MSDHSHSFDKLVSPPWPPDDAGVEEVFARLLADGSWGRYHGPHVAELTELLAARFAVPHVQLCCSGTAAVELALRGVGVGSGDEVLLSAYDFKSNFTNILTLGATPVLIDIRPDDGQLDTSQIAAACSPHTKAVLVSHLHGGLVDLPAVKQVAQAQKLAVIEDACQATGATVAGVPAGAGADVGVLSFGGSKLLTAGRGGAVLTQRDDIAQRIKLYNQRGNEAYPLSEMQAAVLKPQLARLDERHELRNKNVRLLCEQLASRGDLSPLRPFVHQSLERGNDWRPAFYKLGFWYDASVKGISREDFLETVRAWGAPLEAGFRALHRTHARSRYRSANELPHASRADESVVVLHHPILLGTEQEMARLAEIVCAGAAFDDSGASRI